MIWWSKTKNTRSYATKIAWLLLCFVLSGTSKNRIVESSNYRKSTIIDKKIDRFRHKNTKKNTHLQTFYKLFQKLCFSQSFHNQQYKQSFYIKYTKTHRNPILHTRTYENKHPVYALTLASRTHTLCDPPGAIRAARCKRALPRTSTIFYL